MRARAHARHYSREAMAAGYLTAYAALLSQAHAQQLAGVAA
jgi:hypothetical protein